MSRKGFTPLEAMEQSGSGKRLLTGFTLVEILVALIIMSLLVSLSVVTYQKTIRQTDDRACQQNLQVLAAAIDIYALENNALPLTLSKLSAEQIRLAYLKVVGQPKENSLLAFLNGLGGIKPAIAQSLGKYYGNDPKALRCPADKTTATGTSSYTLDAGPEKTFTNTTDLTAKNTGAIIYDGQSWHKIGIISPTTYQNGITPDGYSGDIVDYSALLGPNAKAVKKVSDLDINPQNGQLEDSECDSTCKAELKKITPLITIIGSGGDQEKVKGCHKVCYDLENLCKNGCLEDVDGCKERCKEAKKNCKARCH